MLSWCCKDHCLYNYEINQTQYDNIINQLENSETFSITTLVKQNRKNDFFNFLIVLADKHYTTTHFWKKKSLYQELFEQDFPGTIDIINQRDLKLSSNFIIKEAVVLTPFLI